MKSRHRLMRGLGRGLAGVLLFVFAGTTAQADGASVWSVKGKRNTVYLAGSVHALPPSHAGLSPQLELAYKASEAIVMEVDLDDLDPLEAVQFVAENGTLPASQSLQDVVGATRSDANHGAARGTARLALSGRPEASGVWRASRRAIIASPPPRVPAPRATRLPAPR